MEAEIKISLAVEDEDPYDVCTRIKINQRNMFYGTMDGEKFICTSREADTPIHLCIIAAEATRRIFEEAKKHEDDSLSMKSAVKKIVEDYAGSVSIYVSIDVCVHVDCD